MVGLTLTVFLLGLQISKLGTFKGAIQTQNKIYRTMNLVKDKEFVERKAVLNETLLGGLSRNSILNVALRTQFLNCRNIVCRNIMQSLQ